MSEQTHYASAAKAIIRRWEFRMVASARSAEGMRAQGRTPDPAELEGMAKQARGELAIARAAEEAEPATRRDTIKARIEVLDRELATLGADPSTVSFGPRTDRIPRMRVITAIAVTAIAMVVAAVAVGAFTGDNSNNTVAAQMATVALGALVGGVAGDALSRNRTRLVAGVAIGAIALGTASAWLVAWVAGLGDQNRLLLALLFLVTAVVSGAAWAMASIGRNARDEDGHEIAVARRLAELGALTEELAEAEGRLGAIEVAWAGAGEELVGVTERAAEASS